MSAFYNPLAPRRRAPSAADIKAWTGTALRLHRDATVSVSELSCPLPGCPPRETVILVFRPDMPVAQFSIHKAMHMIVRDDVVQACLWRPDVARPVASKGKPHV